MARFHNQQQPNVDHITGNKIRKSSVFSMGKLPGPLRQLQMDLRKLMLPYTALKLKIYCLSLFNGPMGVTHFLVLSKTETSPVLRVAKTPQGPTLTFKIHEYSLAIVLSGFAAADEQLRLTTMVFKNIFPDIDINTVKLSSCQRIVLLNYNKNTKLIDFRHYSIRLKPVGVSRRIRKFVQNYQVPDLRNLQDMSDFVTKAGYGSESEADEEAATVNLTSDLSRVNHASTKSAVKLQEIGPRMTLQLTKIEGGLCSGEAMFSEYGNGGNKKEPGNEGNEKEDGENDG
ncbi:hypothetical protein E1A91_D06G083000v1 [Gossypium mustelinum]|uniref:Brix domain-containing protein n=1 Tax=Gossypium mustelinum TaxID=34275 RepID=A0A5D2UFS8_GOSMU|nr:hypothetical protein E1A91_D06G083000v1 [Gossypium mustelinum]